MSKDESQIKDSVAALFAEMYARLAGYAVRRLGCVEDAEEAVQEAFMQLFLALLGGEKIANPRGWLLCTVRRRIIDRQRCRQRSHEFAAEGFAERPEAWLTTPAAETEEEDESQLARLLTPLSTREEEVLRLRAEGLKYKEIGTELSITENSVKTLLARAVRKIRGAAAPGGETAKRKEVRAHETLQ